jgi:hypothetical protein
MESNDEDNQKIAAVLILEIIGRPKEHLVETLKNIIEQMGKEPRTTVREYEIKEPVTLKDKEDFFTTFAEVEVGVEGIIDLVILMFKYMPAHIDVLTPELIALTNNGWADILSEITRRLHAYEEVVRVSQIEKNILETKLKDILDKVGKGELKVVEKKQKETPKEKKKTIKKAKKK